MGRVLSSTRTGFLAVNTVGPVYKPLVDQQLLYSVLEGGSLCPWCKSDCVFATYSLFIAVASFFTNIYATNSSKKLYLPKTSSLPA
jgi:hypothetical protein